jgi:putative ABC transport system permease protein
MLKSYIKIAWRNLLKDRLFTLLNLLGLSIGLACTLLIYLWVSDELLIDKFNEKDARLYEVMKKVSDEAGSVQIFKYTQGLLANSLANELPEVEYGVQVRRDDNLSILSFGDKHIKVSHEFAGKDFFRVFSYRVLNGKTPDLSGVKNFFISDQLALKLFNSTDVIGKTVNWNYKDDDVDFNGVYTISGVYESPSNATDHFDILVPFDLYAKKYAGGMGDVTFWGSNMVSTYVILKKGADINAFNNKIKDFTVQKVKSLYPGQEYEKYEGSLFTRRFSDAYLYNNYVNGAQTGGRIEYVRLFSIIAIFILVIACINFMNLSTAKASGRMKEVGIRKVVGAPRRSLILQYMGESMLMSFLSITIAIVLVILLLPAFKQITGKELSLNLNLPSILSLFSIAVITGIIAGSYPALYLSGFKPVAVLKGKLKTSANESFLRKGLVVFQFAISVVLIISVLVVYKQMKLVQTTNLGYNKDNIIKFSAEGKLKDNPETFITEIKNIPGIITASAMNGNFSGQSSHSGGGIGWDGKDPNLRIEYYGVSGDYGFMEILGMKMAEGRTFSRQFGADSSSVIFNEAAIKAMGIKNPVGKTVSLWGKKKQIIGVAKDYHFESLYKKIGPAFIEYSPENETVLVKITAGNQSETISRLEKFYKSFNQGLSFEYRFLDEEYQAMYSSEQRVAILSRYFAAIAIIISCLGLFGLAAFTAQKRQKEIGIRKIVGASVSGIAFMLSKDFLKLVLVSILIAFPAAWMITHQWLQSFAYRTNIGAGIFFIAGGSIVIITLLTISFQSIKAAVMNPVKSLRTE